MAVVVSAVVLAQAVPAGAGTQAGARLVSGSDALGQVSGSLVGQITETKDTFASFLATRRLTPSGILTWRAPVVFDGCIGIRCGKLYLEGHYFYRFKPGTVYYDFELGGYQPGTVGDPAAWVSGGNISVISGGDAGLDGASGVIAFRETEFLSAHTYVGVVRI